MKKLDTFVFTFKYTQKKAHFSHKINKRLRKKKKKKKKKN